MFIFFCEFVRDLSPRSTRLGGVGYRVGVCRGQWWQRLFLARKRDSPTPILCAPYTRYMHSRPRTRPSAKYALKGIVKIGFCPWIIRGGGFGSCRDNAIFFSASHSPTPAAQKVFQIITKRSHRIIMYRRIIHNKRFP